MSDERGPQDRPAKSVKRSTSILVSVTARLRTALRGAFVRLSRASGPGRELYCRLLYSRARRDYWIAIAVGALPIALAYPFGVLHDVEASKESLQVLECPAGLVAFSGVESRRNWRAFVVLIPIALWCVRSVAKRLLPRSGPSTLASLVGPEARPAVNSQIDAAATNPAVLVLVAAIAGLLNLTDAAETISYYMRSPICPREADWSVMFLLREARVAKWTNLCFVVIAYTVQGIAVFLGLLIFGVCLVHNVLYLSLVYQRRKKRAPSEAIVLNFSDANRKFGQGAMVGVLNSQIVYLLVAGAAILVSRYTNHVPDSETLLREVMSAVTKNDVAAIVQSVSRLGPLLPDIGQILLLLAFLFCMLCVLVPSFLKFLPFGAILSDDRARILDATSYLAEFVPEGAPDDPTAMHDDGLTEVAGKFARNSFWPAGDGGAVWLVRATFFVLGSIILPVRLGSLEGTLASLVGLGLAAYLATEVAFRGYMELLRAIDKRLVEGK